MTPNELKIAPSALRLTSIRPIGFLAVLALAPLLIWGLASVTTDENRPVVVPLLLLVLVSLSFLVAVRFRSRGGGSLLEIGFLYALIVSFYGVYPLLGYLLNGMSYSITNDLRLFIAQPNPAVMGSIGRWYVIYLAVFCICYLVCRGATGAVKVPERVKPILFWTSVGYYVAARLVLVAIAILFGISADTYLEAYAAVAQLPLFVRQVFGHLLGIVFTLELFIMAALFFHYRQNRPLILGWLLALGVLTVFRMGSRAALVLLLITTAILYDRFVKRIRLGTAAVVGLATLVLFQALGLVRGGFSDSPSIEAFFRHNSEFESLFANALDVSRRAPGVFASSPRFYFADFIALVPQQLIPFAKLSPSTWYIQTYYPVYAAAGGGLAFGAVPEALVGNGLPDLIWRAAVAGILFGLLHRYCGNHQKPSFWMFALYVWLSAMAYQSFRNTTFAFLPLLVYRFLPVVLLLSVTSRALSGLSLTLQRRRASDRASYRVRLESET